MRLARMATLLAGAAAAYGVRAWRKDREGKEVWAQATDTLPARDAAQTAPAEPERGPEETPQG